MEQKQDIEILKDEISNSIKSPSEFQKRYISKGLENKSNKIWMVPFGIYGTFGRFGIFKSSKMYEIFTQKIEKLICILKWITFNLQRNDLPTSQLDINSLELKFILTPLQFQKMYKNINYRDVVIVTDLDMYSKYQMVFKRFLNRFKESNNILYISQYYSESYEESSYVIDFGLKLVFRLVETSSGIKYQEGIDYQHFISDIEKSQPPTKIYTKNNFIERSLQINFDLVNDDQ